MTDTLVVQPEKTEHEKYMLENADGANLELEVSWNKASENREKLRLTDVGTGTKYIIDRNQLMSILFIISDEGDQMKFMKERLSQVSFQRRQITTVLKKDHQKGETLTIYVDIPVEITDISKRVDPDMAKVANMIKQ